MIIGINHVQVTVPKGKEKEVRAFYCGLMGLKEIPKPESLQERGGLWLQVGDKQVHLAAEDEVYRKLSKAHVAYEVSDLDYWRKLMLENHIEVFSGKPIPGHERFEFRDPFGNRVELIQQVDHVGD